MNSALWEILIDALPKILLAGVKMTIPLTLLSFAFGLIIAIIAALIQYARVPVLKQIMQVYVWLIRGTPLLVQLMIIFYGLPMFGIHADPFWAACVGLSICEGAYMAEALRGCLEGVPEGQTEAGYCVGMNFHQIMRHIVLPQAFRTAFPSLSNSLISLVKDTSLAANITVVEMFMTTQRIAGRTYQFFALYIEVALVYLLFCTVITLIQHRVEKYLNRYAAREA
jgi:cystine transport system permease protein